MVKRDLVMQVIRGAREYSIGTVLFHRAAGLLLGVGVTDMKCLDLMTLQCSASPTELAKHTGLSSGATTAVIDRLEKAGLIKRRPHPKDRRGTTLVLTKEAMQKLPRLFESLANAMEALVSSYSEKQLKFLDDFLSKVNILWKRNVKSFRGDLLNASRSEIGE